MKIRSLLDDWNHFFFNPQPPTPVALFRILFGLLAIVNLLILRPEWPMWYGPHATVSMETMHAVDSSVRINFFELLPQSDFAIYAFFWVFLLLAIFLTAGFLTRFSSVAFYLCLLSIHSRNMFNQYGLDTMMRVTGFFLIFAPAGAVFSVDRWRRIRQGKESAEVPLASPWAQRLIQIQTSVIYFASFCWKLLGLSWINGSAAYYALHTLEIQHFPMPAIHSLLVLHALTWGTLLIEFSLGVLIWFRRLRYPVLLAGLCMHLGIEYALNIPLFEWLSVAAYVNFIYPEDLTRAGAWLRKQIGPKLDDFWNSSLKGKHGRAG